MIVLLQFLKRSIFMSELAATSVHAISDFSLVEGLTGARLVKIMSWLILLFDISVPVCKLTLFTITTGSLLKPVFTHFSLELCPVYVPHGHL